MTARTHPELGSLSENEGWILHCAVNDLNWKIHLDELTLEEVNRLLSVETRKTAITKLEIRKRMLELKLGALADEDYMKRAIETTGLTRAQIVDICVNANKHISGISKENQENKKLAEAMLKRIEKSAFKPEEYKDLLVEMTKRFINATDALDTSFTLSWILFLKIDLLERAQNE